MKIAWKFFIITYTVVILTTSIGAAILVKLSTDAVFNELNSSAFSANDYAVRSFLTLNNKNFSHSEQDNLNNLANQIYDILKSENIESVNLSKQNSSDLNVAERQSYVVKKSITTAYIVINYCVDIENEKYIITTTSDISSAYLNREILWRYYRIIIAAISLLSGILLYLLAKQFSKPLNNLSNAVSKITEGQYGKNITVENGSEEIKILTENFNIMSISIKNKTDALTRETEKQMLFISDFTHELKTPMTSIIGYADLLRRYELDSEEKHQALEYIFNESKRLEKLSMTLMDLLVLNKTTIEYKKINLKDFFDRISDSIKFISDKYKILILTDVIDIIVSANETLLISLMINLIENACKASKAGDTVKILTRKKYENIEIFISDEGIGIDKKDINKITEPFYMVDKSRTRKNGGAGLGLSLCKKITELHNSELIFESEKDKGTIVSFSLPLFKEDYCEKN